MIFYQHVKVANNSLYAWVDFANITSSSLKGPEFRTDDENTKPSGSSGRFLITGLNDTITAQYTIGENGSLKFGNTTLDTSSSKLRISGQVLSDFLEYGGSKVTIKKPVEIGSTSTSQDLRVYGNIVATKKMEALFFNTTSDFRAKDRLTIADFNALSIIKDAPVYSFIYKNNQNCSLGVIAQDLKDVNINNFELVENKEATGKDGDFMQLKESKLVYILWKAIQEQQETIDKLEAMVKDLSDQIKKA